MIPHWSKESCLECVACVGSCPVGALRYTTNRRILVDEENCIGCGRCAILCPVGSIEMEEGGGNGS